MGQSKPIYLKRIAEIVTKAHASGRDVPTIVLPCKASATGELRLYRATAKSKYPGDVQITSGRDGVWFGAINHRTGRTFSRDCPTAILELLRDFDADPAGVGARLGLSVGSCVFCNRKLTTDESKGAGYGPVCADRYGLPWGKNTAVADVAADYVSDEPREVACPVTGEPIPAPALTTPRRMMADRIVEMMYDGGRTQEGMVDAVEKILAGE
jgi:hypothetical protein